MRMKRPAAAIAAALTLTLAAAACSSSGSKGSGSTASGTPTHGGTATVAWISATPNFIFPFAPATNTDGYNQNLNTPLWPYIVYIGNGASSTVNPGKSLDSSITYSNGDKTVTIVLKPWQWSDGKPITSRDFTFMYNLLKVNYKNWNLYLPGLFPANVTSVSAPDTHTVVLNLNQAINPDFFTEDVLSTIQLVPQHAWDKTSDSQAVGNYDETAAGSKAVYDYLQKAGSQISTFATNPLWKVVDGPWTLTEFNSDGTIYGYVPNKNYSGPDKPSLAKWVNQAFTSDTSMMDALRSGSAVDVARLPLNDINQLGQLKAEGYSSASKSLPAVAGIELNFYNTQTGPLARQLYIRQALAELINRQQIVQKVYSGLADPGNGPLVVGAFGSWVSPLVKSGGPYPYNPSAAISLLKAHGWNVVPNGVSTCQSPGTGPSQCGAGISKGEALTFQLAYFSGSATTDQQEAAIQSSEEQAGIKLNLRSAPFNTLIGSIGTCTASSHPASTCGWQLWDAGYLPYNGPYPVDNGDFITGGVNNQGGWSDPTTDNLIKQTEFGSNPQTFFQYEDYIARQLPFLFVPLRTTVLVYKSNLGGFTPLNPFSGELNEEDWYYTK
jgi:peptide/nickel transport system substrate-binding protein